MGGTNGNHKFYIKNKAVIIFKKRLFVDKIEHSNTVIWVLFEVTQVNKNKCEQANYICENDQKIMFIHGMTKNEQLNYLSSLEVDCNIIWRSFIIKKIADWRSVAGNKKCGNTYTYENDWASDFCCHVHGNDKSLKIKMNKFYISLFSCV